MRNSTSFWETQYHDTETDVCIVGGGIVGASAALELRTRMPKARIVLIEEGPFASGASVKNAGFSCFGSIGELLADRDTQGTDQAFLLAEQRYKGLLMLLERCKNANIDYEQLGGYEVFDNRDSFERCRSYIEEFNRRVEAFSGKKTVYAVSDHQKDSGIGTAFPYCISNKLEGQLHPFKMMAFLYSELGKAGIEMHTCTRLNGFQEAAQAVFLDTSRGEYKTRQLLICTNGYSLPLLPSLPLQPARAQVLITEPIKDLALRGTFHFDEGYYYFRNVGNRLLLGGGRHLDRETENTDRAELNPFIQEKLEEFLRDKLGVNNRVEIAQRWTGIMGMGPGKFPLVQASGQRVFCAVRMGGMGIALGSFTGMQAAHMLVEQAI